MFSKKAAILIAAMTLAAALPSAADKPVVCGPFTPSLEIARVSKYVWHGLVLNPDPAIQPSLTFANEAGLSFNFWGSFDTTNIIGKENEFSEMDYTVGYTWQTPFGRPLTTKAAYLTFPDRPVTSFLRLIANTTFEGPLSPCLTVKYDFGNADGACATLALSRRLPMQTASPVSISAQISAATSGFTGAYFGESKAAMTDILLSASMPIQTGDNWAVTPSVNYAHIVDGDLADAVKANGGNRNTWFVNIAATTAF